MGLCYQNNQRSLFRKHRKLLTWFANTQTGKDYFNLPHEDISLLLPNGYHAKRGDTFQMTVTTKDMYARKIWDILKTVDYFSDVLSYKEQQTLLRFEIDGGRAPFDTAFRGRVARFLVSPATFHPDATVESTSTDGWVVMNKGADTWAQIRAEANATTADHTSAGNTTDGVCVRARGADISTLCDRYITLFDTSSLTAAATLTAGANTYALDPSFKTGTANGAMGLVACAPATNTAIVAGDFSAGMTLNTPTEYITRANISSFTVNTYQTITLNTNGDAAISKTGITKFMGRMSQDIDNSIGAGVDSYLSFYTAEDGSLKWPKLSVTFQLPVSGGAFLMNFA